MTPCGHTGTTGRSSSKTDNEVQSLHSDPPLDLPIPVDVPSLGSGSRHSGVIDVLQSAGTLPHLQPVLLVQHQHPAEPSPSVAQMSAKLSQLQSMFLQLMLALLSWSAQQPSLSTMGLTPPPRPSKLSSSQAPMAFSSLSQFPKLPEEEGGLLPRVVARDPGHVLDASRENSQRRRPRTSRRSRRSPLSPRPSSQVGRHRH